MKSFLLFLVSVLSVVRSGDDDTGLLYLLHKYNPKVGYIACGVERADSNGYRLVFEKIAMPLRDPGSCTKTTFEVQLDGKGGIFTIPAPDPDLSQGGRKKLYGLGHGAIQMLGFLVGHYRWRLAIKTEKEGRRVLRGDLPVQCQLHPYDQSGRDDLYTCLSPVHGDANGMVMLYFFPDSDIPWLYKQIDMPWPMTPPEGPSNVAASTEPMPGLPMVHSNEAGSTETGPAHLSATYPGYDPQWATSTANQGQ